MLWTAGLAGSALLATQLALSERWHRLLAAYVFNALAVLSVFAHAEVILVNAFPDYVIENLYQIHDGYYFNWPDLNQHFNDKEFAVTYRTNAQGLRIGAGQDPERRASTADWLVLGDSFTQGAQVEFEELFTTRLSRRFPDKIVINAGISGFGIGHEYNYFVDAGRRFHPDLVILQLGSFNDFMSVEPSLVGLTDRLMTYSAFVRLLLADFKFRNPEALPLGRWTEPFQSTDRANADYNIFYTATSEQKFRDLQNFRICLTKMKQAVEANGGRLLVVLIPTKEQVYPHFLEEVQRAFSIPASSLDMLRPNKLLKAMTRELNVEFLDLLPAFHEAEGRVFFDYDEHLSAFGHHVMADAIAARIEASRGASAVTPLSSRLSGDRYPMLSHDSMLLSYQSFRDGNMEVFVARPDMNEEKRLTFDDVDESHPMLSPDATQIVFTQGAAETLRTDAVIMNLDGSGRQELSEGANVFGAIPGFSPAGERVAYAEWTYDSPTRKFSMPRITVLDRASKQRTLISPADRDSWRPVFSPDGSTLAYISKTTGGQYDIYLHALSSGRVRPLTQTPFDEWDPSFTPDGRAVVYAARPDGNWDLFMTDLETGRVSRLTATRGDEWDPTVAPDGRSILFAGQFGLIDGIFRMRLR